MPNDCIYLKANWPIALTPLAYSSIRPWFWLNWGCGYRNSLPKQVANKLCTVETHLSELGGSLEILAAVWY